MVFYAKQSTTSFIAYPWFPQAFDFFRISALSFQIPRCILKGDWSRATISIKMIAMPFFTSSPKNENKMASCIDNSRDFYSPFLANA